jgi:hypothetical protein
MLTYKASLSCFLGGPLPEVLQETQVWIQDNKVCSEVYRNLSQKIFAQGIPSDSLLCTAGSNRDRPTDACQVSDDKSILMYSIYNDLHGT